MVFHNSDSLCGAFVNKVQMKCVQIYSVEWNIKWNKHLYV